MGVQHPSNSLGTVLFLKICKKLEANVFKFFDSPMMSFVSQPGDSLHDTRLHSPVNPDGKCAAFFDAMRQLPP